MAGDSHVVAQPPPPPPEEPHPGAMILLAIAAEWGAVMSDRKKRGASRR